MAALHDGILTMHKSARFLKVSKSTPCKLAVEKKLPE